MKILLLGDASNYHYSLSRGLALLGHDVTVASNGSGWMNTERHVDLSRSKGKIGGAVLWWKLHSLLERDLHGFDVVQISNPIFVELRPKRVRSLFDKLKKRNGAVCLTALGTDTPYVRMCLDPNSPLHYNEWRINGMPTHFAISHRDVEKAWLDCELSNHCNYIYSRIDGVVSALYEYHLAALEVLPAQKVAYGGIPVALGNSSWPEGKINILCACHKGREKEKGFDRLMPLIKRVADCFPDKVNLQLAQDVPFSQFCEMLNHAHIVIDQLYSYSPSTTPLMAMARGKVVVSGAEDPFYDFIGEKQLRPILNADPANLSALESALATLIGNPSRLEALGRQGRQFVAKHNELRIVAKRYEDFWTKVIR